MNQKDSVLICRQTENAANMSTAKIIVVIEDKNQASIYLILDPKIGQNSPPECTYNGKQHN